MSTALPDDRGRAGRGGRRGRHHEPALARAAAGSGAAWRASRPAWPSPPPDSASSCWRRCRAAAAEARAPGAGSSTTGSSSPRRPRRGPAMVAEMGADQARAPAGRAMLVHWATLQPRRRARRTPETRTATATPTPTSRSWTPSSASSTPPASPSCSRRSTYRAGPATARCGSGRTAGYAKNVYQPFYAPDMGDLMVKAPVPRARQVPGRALRGQGELPRVLERAQPGHVPLPADAGQRHQRRRARLPADAQAVVERCARRLGHGGRHRRRHGATGQRRRREHAAAGVRALPQGERRRRVHARLLPPPVHAGRLHPRRARRAAQQPGALRHSRQPEPAHASCSRARTSTSRSTATTPQYSRWFGVTVSKADQARYLRKAYSYAAPSTRRSRRCSGSWSTTGTRAASPATTTACTWACARSRASASPAGTRSPAATGSHWRRRRAPRPALRSPSPARSSTARRTSPAVGAHAAEAHALGGAWVKVGAIETAADGTYSKQVKQSSSRAYRVVWGGVCESAARTVKTP